jgi:hypothetical protein
VLVVAGAPVAVPVPDEIFAVPDEDDDAVTAPDAREADAVPLAEDDDEADVVDPDPETPANVNELLLHCAPLGTCHPFPKTPVA